MGRQVLHPASPSLWIKSIAVVALVFGLMTVFSGASVLFGPQEAQEWAGDYIRFVVWFNFLAGGFYIVAAFGLWSGKAWAARLSGLIMGATGMVILGFAFVVLRGSAFEMRTVGALAFRFLFWLVIAMMARKQVEPL